MNTTGKLILFITILMIVSCRTEIPKSQTMVLRGVVYKQGDDRPYTGYVVGSGREGYRRQTCRYEKQYANGILNGPSKFWYPNGKLESVEPYEDGKINGVIVRYYSSGQIKARIAMSNGLRGGASGEYFWDKNGKLIKG